MFKGKAVNFIDLTGQKFNRLTVLKLAKQRDLRTRWICKCECGKTKEIEAYALKSGGIKSCGCFKKELTAKRNTKLITTHGMTKTRFYRIWQHMRNRCQNKNNQAYRYYGGRGISVDTRWDTFENFRDDMLLPYNEHLLKFGEKQTTIDRVDNDGNYCKENCRWATYTEQANNRSYSSELKSKAGKLGAIARWGK